MSVQMKVNSREFFSNYMFNPYAEELTKSESCKALAFSIFLGIATLGLSHFFCMSIFSKKKWSIIEIVAQQDQKAQLDFFKPRAEKGNVYAQVRMAKLDPDHKYEWYKKAAKNDNPVACYKIAKEIEQLKNAKSDCGTPLSLFCNDLPLKEEHEWYMKAAEKGVAKAQYKVALKAESDAGVAEKENNMKLVAQKQNEVFKWAMKAAQQKLPEAEFKIGTMYETGKGVEKLQSQANQWLERAAVHGHLEAQQKIAKILNDGVGTDKNVVKGMNFYKMAADAGDVNAMMILGSWYLQQEGDKLPQRQYAAPWFEKAYEAGSPEAAFNLGTMYHDGNGVQQNYETAFKWFSLAANAGLKEAMKNVGNMLKHGVGVTKDEDIGQQWLDKATK